MRGTLQDQTGEIYGRLTVLKDFIWPKGVNRRRGRFVRVRCDCGVVKVVGLSELRKGGTKSCGCLKKEVDRVRCKTHGFSRIGEVSPTYHTWANMLYRCRKGSGGAAVRKYYAGRGLEVCERWASFENFLEDMGERPTPDHSLERLNNDKGYAPDNCKWATIMDQAGNRRSCVYYEVSGERLHLAGWARRFGLPPDRLYKRRKEDPSVENVLRELFRDA